jgi:sn1-specific diacylglycerol lipase
MVQIPARNRRQGTSKHTSNLASEVRFPVFLSLYFTPCTLNQRSRIRVTSDVIFPGQQGPQIIAADIGEPEPSRSSPSSFYGQRSITKSFLSLTRDRAARSGIPPEFITSPAPLAEHKVNLRRLSKMVLAGYGGATLLFFGLSPTHFGIEKSTANAFRTFKDSMAQEKKDEETKLAHAIEASEAEAAGDTTAEQEENKDYSWWDVFLGKYDREIFERSTTMVDSATIKKRAVKMKATAVRS